MRALDLLHRAHDRLRGFRTYLLALLLMVPDLLDKLGAVDWTVVLPEAYAAKVGFALMIFRIVAAFLLSAGCTHHDRDDR